MSSEDSYLSDTPERHAFAQRMLDARDARLRDMAENGVERDEDAHELYVLEVNGKKYVGQTRQRYFRRNGVSQVNSSENRAVQHVDDALKEHGGNCTYLNNAIRKHGLDAIKLTVLFVNVPADDINDLEIRMIRELNTRKPHGYNLQEGGSKGRAHDDTRRKMSEQRQGELHPMYGKNHSVDTRLRLIQAGQKQGLDKDGVTLLPRGIRSVKQKKNYRMYEVTAYRVEEDEIKRYVRLFAFSFSIQEMMEWKQAVEHGGEVTNGKGEPLKERGFRDRDWSAIRKQREERVKLNAVVDGASTSNNDEC